MEKIGMASDHAGFKIKEYSKKILENKGIEYEDFGTYNNESCDYPIFGHKLGKAIQNGDLERGIAVCATGQGMNMTLNKYGKIRAALCWNKEVAHFARAHNNANVLILPGKFVSEKETEIIINEFLSTSFEGGRHLRRINEIPCE